MVLIVIGIFFVSMIFLVQYTAIENELPLIEYQQECEIFCDSFYSDLTCEELERAPTYSQSGKNAVADLMRDKNC